MEPADPGAPATPTGRGRLRPRLAALGFLALPVFAPTFVVPAMASASIADPGVVQRPAAGLPAPAPAPAPAPGPAVVVVGDEQADTDAALAAFHGAGYTYEDGVELAERWASTGPFQAKIEAGSFLARGLALADSPAADPTADDGVPTAALTELFFALGHTGQDAAVLAEQWGVGLGEAEVRAGSELTTVGALPWVDPAVPAEDGGTSPQDAVAVDAFFAAGHDYADAVVLADFWTIGTFEAKIRAGSWLLAGEPLPAMAGLDRY